MVDDETISQTTMSDKLALLSQLDNLRSAWHDHYPNRAKGGLLALSGFEYQFLLTLLKIVHRWKEASETERHKLDTAHNIVTEAISDITESGLVITITQVKRTLSETLVREALEELWEIFNLASECTPGLVGNLRFVISGKFEGDKHPVDVIRGWGIRAKKNQVHKLDAFKNCVKYELISDPRADLTTELENLSRDEDTATTIDRWLGYFLQLGSGISPERVSSLIWRDLGHDKSLEAFRATLARLFSQSRYRLRAVRHTLGRNLSLPRTDKLSQLQASVLAKQITLLTGPSGSGKSALCKLSMQTIFQHHTSLFLHPQDVINFTEKPDSSSRRNTRRIDELIIAKIIDQPLIIIDDLNEVDDQSFNCVLNLIQNVLANETSTDVRFVLIAHLDTESSICEKIAARLGTQISTDYIVKLPQLPINELQSSNALTGEVAHLVQRADEFGPAFNLKLLDWLIRSVQQDGINVSSLRNDLDLLAWFWRYHVGNGSEVSEQCSALINISLSLAEKFTPDLPRHNLPIAPQILNTLMRRDCLRVAEERIAVTHRFVGDCGRFRYLLGNFRELEVGELATRLRNPLWSQPFRWFALYLAMKSAETETWQELLQEALEGRHLQLVDLLLDGVILSRQPSSVLNACVGEQLPFFIERLFSRLFAIATDQTPDLFGVFESMSASAKLISRERTIGTPKAHLWEPVWCWLLALNQEALIEKSDLIFKAAEAWLNWGVAERFPLRLQVAQLIIDMAQRVLLPNPDEQQRNFLDDSSTAAFACIVFGLKIIPERSAWLSRALVGREIIPANRLEPTETSPFLTRPGIGVLTNPHPRGPSGRVNDQFREFMLNQGGIYLRAVIRVNPDLGAELLLALTISPPVYRYEFDDDSDIFSDDLGTEGSDDIDVCTFKFLPLLSLFQINETLAVDVVATLCNIATDYWHEHRWTKNKLEGMPETDTDGVTLLISNKRKYFKGGRHTLYWHRNYSFSPRIVACFLMTLEGWLYSRPTKAELDHSISIIFERADTVAILGVLISLAKSDPRLLSDALLPLASSLQLLLWQEFEQIDQGQDFGFDSTPYALRSLSEEEGQELLDFHRLSYRKLPLLNVVLQMWLEGLISLDTTSQILQDWDNEQIALIPDENRYRVLKIRAWFDHNNWLLEDDVHGNRNFRLIGDIPKNPEVDVQAESALWNLKRLEIVMNCRHILDGKLQKSQELHRQLIAFLKNQAVLDSLQERLDEKDFLNVIWAAIAIILESPPDTLEGELEAELNYLADNLSNTPIRLDHFSRCQYYDLDAAAFIAHVAPKLLRRLQSESSLRAGAFRCLIGVRDRSTSAFMRSWIKEHGFANSLTRELINLIPLIARLIALSYAFSYTNIIQKVIAPDGSYIVPRPEVIDQAISNQDYREIEEAWSILQNDFVERKISEKSIIDVSEWTPEILNQPLKQLHRWLDNGLDWEFLAAALIPVLEAQTDSEIALNLVDSLREQVIFALLHERKIIYTKDRASKKNNNSNSVKIKLYKAQSKILDLIVILNYRGDAKSIDIIIEFLHSMDIVDCVILHHVAHTLIRHNLPNLSNSIIEGDYPKLIDKSLQTYTAFTIAEYLFELRNQQESDLRIIGNIRDVWEELIKLLLEEFQENNENATNLDTRLTEFFKRFQDVLLPDWWLRRKLYQVGKTTKYRQFRRVLFKAIIQYKELLPKRRNDESELLVQVIAELWDSDKNCLINRQSQREGLRTLLGQLQEIDAVGARKLSEQIADSLIHPPDYTI
ncbi:MAG TPA: ATP-binding protein [Nodularia sp. (in: cyanobacteria)]|nr:ATP-binding protein [Nodularia sp. (in: cyanobacteria)]